MSHNILKILDKHQKWINQLMETGKVENPTQYVSLLIDQDIKANQKLNDMFLAIDKLITGGETPEDEN